MIRFIRCLPLIMVLPSCSDGCRNTPIQEVFSPDKTMRVCVFSRDCNATVPHTVHVHLGAPKEDIPDLGNIFRGTHSATASVHWEGNHKLVIRTSAKPFLLMKEYSGVAFELRQP
jgi:hypothetical protein